MKMNAFSHYLANLLPHSFIFPFQDDVDENVKINVQTSTVQCKWRGNIKHHKQRVILVIFGKIS